MSNYEVRAGMAELDSFTVCGISVKTQRDRAAEDINALWEEFFRDSVGQKIKGKKNDNIYAVYHDYHGDEDAPFTLTIGYQLEDNAPNNTDFNTVSVEDQNYAVMSAAGQQPKALMETWEAIWSSDLPRSFKTDFELYGARFFEEGINEVLVHIGVNQS